MALTCQAPSPTVSWSFDLEGTPFTHDRPVHVQRTEHQPPTPAEA
jgi:hypothetical protein